MEEKFVVMTWLGIICESFLNQKEEIWVRRIPLVGIPWR